MSTSGAAPAGGPPSGAAGGDLGGVYPAPSVVGLQGRGISATAPTDTQGLIWNNGLGLWVPTSLAIPAASNLVTGPDAFGAAAVVGTAATFSRGDHNHGLPANPTPAFAAPTIALGTAAAAGAAGTIIRSDATIAAFDATAPVTQAFGDAAGAGAAAVTARRDHRHGMPAAPVTSLNGGTGAIAQTNGYGVSGANSNPPAPAVGLTTASAFLTGADLTLTANTPTNVVSLSLAAGTWLVLGQISFDNTAAGANNLEAWLTTTTAGAGSTGISGFDAHNTPASVAVAAAFHAIVTPGATTTYFMVAESSSGASVLHAGDHLTAAVLTGLVAVRLA